MSWLYQPMRNWVLQHIVVTSLVIIRYVSYSLIMLYTTPVGPTTKSKVHYVPKTKRYKTPHIISRILQLLFMLCQVSGHRIEA
jgi:hypothetical protein